MIKINQDENIKKPHISYNSKNNEWYTPAKYIEAVTRVMGVIDLDPASNEIANKTVQAGTYYSIDNDGLSKEWRGRVFMNPPYSRDLLPKFVDKLIYHLKSGDVQEAIILVNNATETNWFNSLIGIASAIIFPSSRVKYYMPDGKTGTPLQGQAFIYIGRQKELFFQEFSKFGWCAYPNAK